MREYKDMQYHPTAERVVKALCVKGQVAGNPMFFRVLVAYYLAKVASMMRANIKTHDRGEIPINLYVLNLATSGYGL